MFVKFMADVLFLLLWLSVKRHNFLCYKIQVKKSIIRTRSGISYSGNHRTNTVAFVGVCLQNE